MGYINLCCIKYAFNCSCDSTFPFKLSRHSCSPIGSYTRGDLVRTTTPHWKARRCSNACRRSSRRRRTSSFRESFLAGGSTGIMGICVALAMPTAEYTLPELCRMPSRNRPPREGDTPAHLGPMPITTLAGFLSTRPHFLHFTIVSITTLL